MKILFMVQTYLHSREFKCPKFLLVYYCSSTTTMRRHSKYQGVNPSKIPSSEVWANFGFPAISAKWNYFGTLYMRTFVGTDRWFTHKTTVSERRIRWKSKTRIPDKEIKKGVINSLSEAEKQDLAPQDIVSLKLGAKNRILKAGQEHVICN